MLIIQTSIRLLTTKSLRALRKQSTYYVPLKKKKKDALEHLWREWWNNAWSCNALFPRREFEWPSVPTFASAKSDDGAAWGIRCPGAKDGGGGGLKRRRGSEQHTDQHPNFRLVGGGREESWMVLIIKRVPEGWTSSSVPSYSVPHSYLWHYRNIVLVRRILWIEQRSYVMGSTSWEWGYVPNLCECETKQIGDLPQNCDLGKEQKNRQNYLQTMGPSGRTSCRN